MTREVRHASGNDILRRCIESQRHRWH